jgi:hypothetical protein
MKNFFIAATIWSIIFYIKGKYFDVRPSQNDVDYILDGIWIWGIPIVGATYGGLTILAIKIIRAVKSKLTKLKSHQSNNQLPN